MKIQFVLIFCFTVNLVLAQNNSQLDLSITTSVIPADPSAMLDVQSDHRGVLIPRLTTVQMNAINSPANGLLIYVTDENCFFFNEGHAIAPNWKNLCAASADNSPNNEIQTISKNGRKVSLSTGGGSYEDSFIEASFGQGGGRTIQATRDFIVTPKVIAIETGDQVLITSHRAMGSNAIGGAGDLDLYICYRELGSINNPSVIGLGFLNMSIPQQTKIPMGMSAIWDVTSSSGQYECGLCGDDDGNGNWDNNDWSYTTTVIIRN